MLRCGARAFRALGVDAEILATGSDRVGAYAPRLEDAGYRIHHIPFRKSPMFFVALYRLLRRQHFDVLHVHTERAGMYLCLVARLAGVRCIVSTAHSAFRFDGLLRIRRALQRRFTVKVLGAKRVAISPSVEENERRRFGIDTIVIPNWYDSDAIVAPDGARRREARAALQIADATLVLVAVGNCAPVKNHDALIRGLARTHSRDTLLLHVGRESPCQEERALAEQLGVADRIRFLGAQPDVRPFLHAADAFVHPSTYEGFGVAAVEALAAGLPCIFTRVEGLRDFAAHYPGIVYCEPDDASIATAIDTVAAMTDSERQTVARDYPTISRTRFGIDSGVLQYVSLYRGTAATLAHGRLAARGAPRRAGLHR